jgi:16S rRNA (guanine527-N7)-methyltransferase
VEHENELRNFLKASATSIGLALTPSHVDQFMTYLQELIRWNKKINLTGVEQPKDIIVKHFVDSLAALNAWDFPLNGVAVDIGSGAGFPGIPLKIVREDLRLILVEPVHKKSSFLKSLIGLLKLSCASTFDGTVQEYVKAPATTLADVALVRAVKFNEIMSSIKELLHQGGRALLYRTKSIEPSEITNNFALVKELSFALPFGYGQRIISVLEIGKVV